MHQKQEERTQWQKEHTAHLLYVCINMIIATVGLHFVLNSLPLDYFCILHEALLKKSSFELM